MLVVHLCTEEESLHVYGHAAAICDANFNGSECIKAINGRTTRTKPAAPSVAGSAVPAVHLLMQEATDITKKALSRIPSSTRNALKGLSGKTPSRNFNRCHNSLNQIEAKAMQAHFDISPNVSPQAFVLNMRRQIYLAGVEPIAVYSTGQLFILIRNMILWI